MTSSTTLCNIHYMTSSSICNTYGSMHHLNYDIRQCWPSHYVIFALLKLRVLLHIQITKADVQIKMTNVKIKMTNVQIKMTNVQIRMTNVQIKTTNVHIRIINVQIKMINCCLAYRGTIIYASVYTNCTIDCWDVRCDLLRLSLKNLLICFSTIQVDLSIEIVCKCIITRCRWLVKIILTNIAKRIGYIFVNDNQTP